MIMFPKMHDKAQDPKTFQEAVNELEEIHKKCIKVYCAQNGIDTILDDVYNASNGKPGPSQGLGKEAEEHGTL